MTEDMLGVVNVRLTLLYSTILFVSREAFRRACLSQKENHRWQQTINLIWCNVPLGVISAALLGFVWSTQLETPDPD
ncbi:oligosaccharide translocation protein RFT1, partial [Salmonella sp. s54395]|uniref:oligosaccharide translocation protein RFT1 n=1 Tax=Salmonella sp. s54395 TaxID=3159664 RepID=UPI00398096C8